MADAEQTRNKQTFVWPSCQSPKRATWQEEARAHLQQDGCVCHVVLRTLHYVVLILPSVSPCSCETSAVIDMPLPRSTLLIAGHNFTVSCFHEMILDCTSQVGEEICHSVESITHFG
jgi:hypothetical protein